MSKQVTPDKLIADLQAVVCDAEALLEATAAQAGEKIQNARARTEESLRQVKVRLGDVEDEALKGARTLPSEANAYIRANPWRVIGTAAGVAIVLGLLISRR